MKLKPGDIFFQTSGTWLDAIINFFQSLWSGDKRSIFSHCGIVAASDGATYETSMWRTGFYNLKSRQGRKTLLCVMRHKNMDHVQYLYTPHLSGTLHAIYPYWRLLLFAVGLAKHIHLRNMVCSEIVACFLYSHGMTDTYWGVSVDDLWDQVQTNQDWETVYLKFGWEEKVQ